MYLYPVFAIARRASPTSPICVGRTRGVVVHSERLLGVGKGTEDALIDDDMFWEPPPIRAFCITLRHTDAEA